LNDFIANVDLVIPFIKLLKFCLDQTTKSLPPHNVVSDSLSKQINELNQKLEEALWRAHLITSLKLQPHFYRMNANNIFLKKVFLLCIVYVELKSAYVYDSMFYVLCFMFLSFVFSIWRNHPRSQLLKCWIL
jgi:hypothetical protein